MHDFISQALGILALTIMILSYQQRDRRTLLLLQICCNVFFAASYYMLGAVSGVGMSIINICRSFVFSKSDTEWGKSPVWLYVFLALSLLCGILTWEGPISLFIIAATLILTVALYCKDSAKMRRMLLIPPLFYITYNLVNRSLGGIASDVFCLISVLVAIWRFDLRK